MSATSDSQLLTLTQRLLDAIDNRDWLKASAIFRSLPELRKQVNELQRRLAALEAAASPPGTPDESAGGAVPWPDGSP